MNWLALTTLIFSAAATLGSFKGGGYGGTATISQILASDQWAFYQAKSIKQHTFELQRDALTLQALSAPDATQAKYKDTLDRNGKDISRYDGEKKEIKGKAEDLEKQRDNASKLAGIFGKAVLYLQVSIMLAALAALLKKPLLWVIGFAPGLAGLMYFANGFFLFF